MFSTTTATLAALLFTASTTTVNAIPIWSRLAALAIRADPTTPAELAQGSNFFFDSLRLEDPCTPSQIGCISSQLAKCSQEGNWEITPCTGNTTCLAVPASDDTGIFVSCLLFTDAQTDIGSQNVTVDFGVSSPPNNTATAPLSPLANATSTDSLTDGPAPTNSTDPTDSLTDSVDPTNSSTDSADPSPSDSVDPTDSSTDPTPTDNGTNPTPTLAPNANATCTDDGPEETTTELITVIIQPDATQPGELVTTTLFPNDTAPTSTDNSTVPDATSTNDSSVPTLTDSNAVTGTDAATFTSIPDPAAATATVQPSGNCTETNDPSTEDPTDTLTDSNPEPTTTDSSTDGISTAYGSAPTNTTDSTDPNPTDSVDPSTQTGLTLTVPPNFSLPSSSTNNATGTDTPANNVAPTPSANPDVSVIGTNAIPAPSSSSAPARMVRVRRA